VLQCVSAVLMWWLLKNSEKDTMRNLQAEKEKKGVEDVEEKGEVIGLEKVVGCVR
jgi:hypothetical protein